MVRSGKAAVIGFMLLISSATGTARVEEPAKAPKKPEIRQEVSDPSSDFETLRKEMISLKDSVATTVTLDVLKFFVPLIIASLLLGGFGAWFILQKEAREAVKANIEHVVKDARDHMSKQMVLQWWHLAASRDDSMGAFWQQLFEETLGEGEPRRLMFLNLALQAHRRAVASTVHLDESKYERSICIYKNNLAHCLSLKTVAGTATAADKEKAMQLIVYARDKVQKNPDNFREIDYRIEETYGWVLLRFSGDNKEELQKGQGVMDALFSRGDLPRDWHEARMEKYKGFLARSHQA